MTIDIRDLSFGYNGDQRILENINLSVAQGEFLGIFGPNGGGKTTLLKLILGLLKPTSGTLAVHSEQRIGYVPQVVRFDRQFPISTLEVVLMGCLGDPPWWGWASKASKKKARTALERLGLSGMEEAPFGTLSGGQAQRALIARALVNEPDLLLLDEPTASVDACAEAEIYQILNSLKGKMTILMVTHDLQTLIDKAGRFLCVHRHVTSLLPAQICEHFALGLYHTPLKRS